MGATLSLPPLQRTAPLADQIERFFRSAIQHGRLRAGARLPAIRTMAEQLGVTRNAVQEAYRRLAEAGLVTATVGRGTQVLGSHGENGAGNPFSAGARAARRTLESAPRAPAKLLRWTLNPQKGRRPSKTENPSFLLASTSLELPSMVMHDSLPQRRRSTSPLLLRSPTTPRRKQ